MHRLRSSLKLARWRSVATASVCALAAAFGAPATQAAPVGNIVTLGDSFTANPSALYKNFGGVVPGLVPEDYPNQEGCLQAPDNWPRLVGAQVGAPVADWSCTAQTSRTMLERLDRAIVTGDLHAGTRAVVMAIGMNNFGPFGVKDGTNPLDGLSHRQAFLDDIRAATERIRATAPQAKIVLSGMPSVSTGPSFCAVNIHPDNPGLLPEGLHIPLLGQVEDENSLRQAQAAAENGIAFVNLRDATRNNGTCAPRDSERMVAGIVDFTSPQWNIVFHPTVVGSRFMADQIAPHV
ncbi:MULTISPECIES: GDSL-type esterase/lipase family protein [unclassified Corynebacterium]|uniref:GDSL-type esterase/lipase family protein n=1 Tax=unclassified Corynebacterium TaxID=2624378 RepID=UPI0029C9E030|nr:MULTISPECIES: GDSL-type esterase/lipase family protein [unclassified Corynebacterium]WPF66712.1 GDSL-type esterase/lipase family protein [Corynebacterium sp. 22KM0430]WPF69200.1 GDSL-type esterase/lipase family protein [Corynebacterium sp. 21KM1197]